MKTIIVLISFLFNVTVAGAQTGSVAVTVENIISEKGGELSAGMFDKAENYPKIGKGMITKVIEVTGSSMEVIYEGIPIGKYALAIYQDIDKNKDLKTNFIGLPREPPGFSNNVKVRFGPSSFEDAAVVVEKNKVVALTIRLIDY